MANRQSPRTALLALLGVLLGLAAKRSGRAPGMVVGGSCCWSSSTRPVGPGLVEWTHGARISVGRPLPYRHRLRGLLTSCKRPGETPVGRAMEQNLTVFKPSAPGCRHDAAQLSPRLMAWRVLAALVLMGILQIIDFWRPPRPSSTAARRRGVTPCCGPRLFEQAAAGGPGGVAVRVRRWRRAVTPCARAAFRHRYHPDVAADHPGGGAAAAGGRHGYRRAPTRRWRWWQAARRDPPGWSIR